MIDRATRSALDILGPKYWIVLAAGEAAISMIVVTVSVVVLATYFDPERADVLAVCGLGWATTLLAIGIAVARAKPELAQATSWRSLNAPTVQQTIAAWESATTVTLRQFRRSGVLVQLLAALPAALLAQHLWHTGWDGFASMMIACAIPGAYGAVLSYSAGEVLGRPVVHEIAAALPNDFPFADSGLAVSTRLTLSLPAYTMGTAVLVAGLVSDQNGAGDLLAVVCLAAIVGIPLARELTILLSHSITRPLADIRDAMTKVRAGDYSARVPVLSSDEVGELAHAFNLMSHGLSERDRMRGAFETYVDREVVELILSGQFPDSGVEIDVSVLFCDVRGFTHYAETAAASDVIATLNLLYAQIVPIVVRHGGHVDKFMGDGMLAVFGAPAAHEDHADRALEAALEIVKCQANGLTVSAGVNSGPVVAGPVGGGGRLNFSVIGDTVNIAARVEAATRSTGDDLLLTASSRGMLRRQHSLVSRGPVRLKGKADPVELLAPVDGSGPSAAI